MPSFSRDEIEEMVRRWVAANDEAELLDQMQLFAEQVVPRLT